MSFQEILGLDPDVDRLNLEKSHLNSGYTAMRAYGINISHILFYTIGNCPVMFQNGATF